MNEYVPKNYLYTETGESKLFTKSNDRLKTRKFGFWGLGFHAQHALDKIGNLKVGESFKTDYGYILKRVF